MVTTGSRAWQDVKTQRIVLANGAVMQLVPIDRHKGRHWVVYFGDQLIGEWKTWQRSIYTRQPKGTYGRGGGTYRTVMVRESWLAGIEDPEKPDTERQVREFRSLAARYPDHTKPSVRRIKKA